MIVAVIDPNWPSLSMGSVRGGDALLIAGPYKSSYDSLRTNCPFNGLWASEVRLQDIRRVLSRSEPADYGIG